MKTIFKVGDKVFDIRYRWGEVTNVNVNGLIKVFFGFDYHYAADAINIKLLSFTEYTLEGFSEERPKEPLPFKVGDVVYVSDDYDSWITTKLSKIKLMKYPFKIDGMGYYKYLAFENPLKNSDTKIYSKEDL